MKKIVFGLGSGRCGTMSLAMLLNAQLGATIPHEEGILLPWERSVYTLRYHMERVMCYPGQIVGNVAYYYLNYVSPILNFWSGNETKFVCLKRNKEETTESLWRCGVIEKTCHFVDERSEHWNEEWLRTGNDYTLYRNTLPHYDLPEKEAISKFYDEYYRRADQLAVLFPQNFKIFDMNETLNTREGQIKLLDWIGIKDNQVLNPKIKVYRNKDLKGEDK